MKLRFLYILITVFAINLGAQSGTNQWINYSQKYFKFPVTANGIYKITYATLFNAGINVGAIKPQNFQVFGRGEEQYIYISEDDDEIFDPNDYILVYAQKNDSYFDDQMYKNPADNPNPYYSLINDTIYYFVTYNNSMNNKRIIEDTDKNYTGYTASPYFNYETVTSLNNQYGRGKPISIDNYLPTYSAGEGWIGETMKFEMEQSYILSTPSYYSPAGDGTIETAVVGLSNDETHYPDHQLTISVNDIVKKDTTYEGHDFLKFSFSIPPSEWENSSVVKFKSGADANFTKADRSAVGYIKIKYPHTFDLGNATSMEMGVLNGTSNKAFLSISNFNNQNTTPWLFDITNHARFPVTESAGPVYKTLVPNTVSNSKKCLLTSEANFINVTTLEPAIYSSYAFANYKNSSQAAGGYDYFILTVKEFKAAADMYKDYRNSTGYKAVVIDMEELYMQYSDGIRKHPMAIRGFAKDILENWDAQPQYFFLLGKSVHPGTRDASNYKLNKIPTFGYPGSDVFLTAQISDSSIYDPDIPIGRLSATTGAEITNYLNKVQEFEAHPHAHWMKRVLHFGGGTNQGQGNQFADYLNKYKRIIQDTCFGGTVNTYLKNTSDPLQVNVSDSIRTNINGGTSIMTFFGHAYGSGFDQNIDAPDSYENQGKYPLIIANSCLIGNIHLPSKTSGSETWVLTPNKGAIGFLASASLGIPTPLDQYTTALYENFGQKHYGKGIGKIMQLAIRNIQIDDDPYKEDVCMMMTLHCDPAIVLNAHKKPDYTIYGPNGSSQPLVVVNPTEVTSELNSFTINIEVANIGKAIDDSIEIRLIRKFPSNTTDALYIKKIAGVRYKSAVQFILPVDLINGVGTNHFSILVDSEYAVDELDESNNQYELDVAIRSGDIVPVYPYQYAIVPKKSVVLKASTIDPFAPERKYIFQIDTNRNFSSSSPLFYQASITKSGGVVSWDPADDPGLANVFNSLATNTTLAKPTVFFWRVSLDSAYLHKFNWKYSSFQYVQGKSGWGQAHFQQLNENTFNFINANEQQRSFSFIEHIKELYVQTNGASVKLPLAPDLYRIDGALMGYGKLECPKRTTENLIQVAVIDNYSLKPWQVNDLPDFGQINEPDNYALNFSPYGDKTFWFETPCNSPNTDGGDYFKGINTLLDSVKTGDFIALYTYRKANFRSLFNDRGADGVGFKKNLQMLGANVDSLENYAPYCSDPVLPYILVAQKGNPSFAKEAFNTSPNTISVTADLKNNWINGTIKTPAIGPALKWGSLHWESKSNEINPNDTVIIKVIGVDANSNETTLKSYLAASGDVLSLDTLVNAATYPYIRLESYLSDDSLHTPNQLQRWQIVYDEVPEIALSPNIAFSVSSDSLQEGNDYKMMLALVNVSETDADSLQITYWFSDATLTNSSKQYKLLPPLKAGDFYIDTVSLSTLSINGDNHLWYEVNPYAGPKPWQVEQYHFNNILENQFSVYPDKINPLLDVAFDGIHIINGDIVSPKALVTIQLKDENKFLSLDDDELFSIVVNHLNKDNQIDATIPLGPNDYTFYPATLPDNKCRIEFKCNFTEAGKYELGVKAIDRSANKSGKGDGSYDYRIQFEVVMESTITNILNWPNPFTTSTQFVFVLTGSEVPTDFRIKIMNITGKVVKEISMDELGPINIGRNITQYKWDGTDEFGDMLANGVYLYIVDAKINGETIDTREVRHDGQTLESQYFKKSFGKMYIMR